MRLEYLLKQKKWEPVNRKAQAAINLEREFRESHSLYRQREAQNPDYGRRIADSLSRGAPQALDDVEHAALLNQVIQAEDEFDDAVKGSQKRDNSFLAEQIIKLA